MQNSDLLHIHYLLHCLVVIMNDLLHGFAIGETGYGFDDDNKLYSYTRTIDTDYMGNLFHTKLEAVNHELESAIEYCGELLKLRDELKNE